MKGMLEPVFEEKVTGYVEIRQTYKVSKLGTIGGGCGEHEVLRKALEVLSDKKDMFLSVDMTNDFAGEEGMVCGGTMDVIIRYVPGKVEI